MARLTVGQKARRVLTFLAALANPLIALRLRGYGLDQTELDRGWGLLRASSSLRLNSTPIGSDAGARSVVLLDAWENFWFPITQTVLRVRFPAVEKWMFLNLTQQEGDDVVLSVGTLVARLEQLDSKTGLEGEVAAQAEDARKLLADRGLTPEIVNEARGLLDDIARLKTVSIPDPEAQQLAKKEAEREMWAWYLEWSAIAQRVITNRRHLRELGYKLSPKGAPGPVVLEDLEEEEEVEEIDETEETEDFEGSRSVA